LRGYDSLKIRKAKISDLKEVHRLINFFAKKEQMLPRSLNEIYETLRDFVICEDKEKICGACALHIMWEDLAEIRSLAVDENYQNIGIGRKLVKHCLKDAQELGIKQVFVLTYNTNFFKKFGFVDVEKSSLPQKIWGDCLRCPRFPECDELAVIKYL
jgi:amino-acid N-acetyltransferase